MIFFSGTSITTKHFFLLLTIFHVLLMLCQSAASGTEEPSLMRDREKATKILLAKAEAAQLPTNDKHHKIKKQISFPSSKVTDNNRVEELSSTLTLILCKISRALYEGANRYTQEITPHKEDLVSDETCQQLLSLLVTDLSTLHLAENALSSVRSESMKNKLNPTQTLHRCGEISSKEHSPIVERFEKMMDTTLKIKLGKHLETDKRAPKRKSKEELIEAEFIARLSANLLSILHSSNKKRTVAHIKKGTKKLESAQKKQDIPKRPESHSFATTQNNDRTYYNRPNSAPLLLKEEIWRMKGDNTSNASKSPQNIAKQPSDGLKRSNTISTTYQLEGSGKSLKLKRSDSTPATSTLYSSMSNNLQKKSLSQPLIIRSRFSFTRKRQSALNPPDSSQTKDKNNHEKYRERASTVTGQVNFIPECDSKLRPSSPILDDSPKTVGNVKQTQSMPIPKSRKETTV